MKPSILKRNIQNDLFTTAVNVHLRHRQPAHFVLACDVDEEDGDGNAPALAYVLVISADDAIELEAFMRSRRNVMLETLRKDFEE